jgi:regulator of protease activity HflC (stomatin/prohibitin superfamily)
MKNSPLFLISISIIILFGFRVFFVLLIIYLIVNKFFPVFLKFFKKFLADFNSNIENAKIVKPQKFLSFNFNFMQTRNIIFSVLGLFFLFLILDGFVMIPVGHTGVILDRGRGVLEKTLDTGLHLKVPFWQKITAMTTQLQTYTMSGVKGEGNFYKDDSIEALTKDGQKVEIDITVQFRLQRKNAPYIYQEVGLDYVDKIIRPASRSVIRNIITGFNSKELFQLETRAKAQKQMNEQMSKNIASKKLLLEDVLLRNIKFSDIYLNAIEEKQIAEQKIQKAEFEKQESEITKQKKIIEAEAEAESIKLRGQALKDNPSVIQLNMIEKLSPNINWGVLPDNIMPLLDLKKLENK